MDEREAYDAPIYVPPGVVETIGAMLRAPRNAHTTNFADVFSPDKELQYDYVYGLLTVAIILFSIFFFWTLALVVLKFKGSEVGCASGHAFYRPSDDVDSVLSTDSEDFGSTSSEEFEDRQRANSLERHIEQQQSEDSSSRGDNSYSDYDSQEGWISTSSVPLNHRISRREKRTRIAFLIFSFIALVSVPSILVFSFGPMKEAARSSDDIVLAFREALFQTGQTFDIIDEAIDSARGIVEWTPTSWNEVCPNIPEDRQEALIGIDLRNLTRILSGDFEGLIMAVEQNTTGVGKLLEGIDGNFITFEENVDRIEDFMWIVPGLLFAVSMLAAGSMLGVLLAWREKSGRCVQLAMSYVALPLLILVTIGCWVVVVSSAFGTMMASDFCTAGPSPGSPDEAIQQILSAHSLDHDSYVYKLASAYTNGCAPPVPSVDVEGLERMVQDVIDLIWRQISEIDSIGRDRIVELCGGLRTRDLTKGAISLAKQLTAIRRSLDSASGSLECDRINPIYIQGAHSALCTTAASASAYGFILFFILSISTMTMISLRASWLRNIVEEKVYHDESEVAENMILDEHEEYLAYISKYKHEWQEYRGFDSSTFGRRSDDGSFDEEDSGGSIYFEGSAPRSSSRYGDDGSRTDGEGYNGSDECSEDAHPSKWIGGSAGLDPTKDGAILGAAADMDDDDISFPSLPANKSDESSIGENTLFVLPAPLLPPPENPEFRTDDEVLESGENSRQQAAPDMTDLATMKNFDKYVCETGGNKSPDEIDVPSSPRGPGTPNDRYDATEGDAGGVSKDLVLDEIEVTLSQAGDSQQGRHTAKVALPAAASVSALRGPNVHRAQSAPKVATPKMGKPRIHSKSFDNRSRAEI